MVKKTVEQPEEVCQYTLEKEQRRELARLRKERDILRRELRKKGRHAWANIETEGE